MQRIFIPFFLAVILVGAGCTPVVEVEKPAPVSSDNITVSLPLTGDVVGNPIHVVGEARVFENVVSWRLRDAGGSILTSGTTEAAALDMGLFGPFDFYVVVPAPYYPGDPVMTDRNMTLEVFQASAKDGSDTDLVSIPLQIDRLDIAGVEIYLHNDTMDPEMTCTKVFQVTRKIIATDTPARAAMVMLLQGPTPLELANQYSTIIPFRTELKDISISEDGVATVDLKGAIAGSMGGSCYVSAIAREIEDTLKQFNSVKEVKILINGEADRLQP
ncbi:MAG: Gmad2 immunoglobulin-like domain-containing protein [Patescibacteria group bacterium]|jgi:hypothetical protein